MPRLLMPLLTFNSKERDLISKITAHNQKLNSQYENEVGVYIIGKKDDHFWKRHVLSKATSLILDPYDDFPIRFIDKIIHFGVISFEVENSTEIYYGNVDFDLEGFVRAMLLKAIEMYEGLNNPFQTN